MTAWQPMETAPRDGTTILLKTAQGVVDAWWCPPEVVHHYFEGDDVEGCLWVCYDDAFEIQVEWANVEGEDCPFWDSSSGILGWMPIPE